MKNISLLIYVLLLLKLIVSFQHKIFKNILLLDIMYLFYIHVTLMYIPF